MSFIFQAFSLLYGGPAPHFLSDSVIAYLLDGPLSTAMIEDIPDCDIQSSLYKVYQLLRIILIY